MAQTLQEHYNSIKSGKGNKAQFLRQARELFPQYFNQYSDFNTTINVLKSKQIINEAVGGVVSKGFDIFDWKKILAEEVKAEEKETSKEVKDANKHAYDNADMKNADNINFNEIMKGFYAELKDAKNHDKTAEEIKAMVVKNLAKDCLYYTKDGEFGVKGLGYTTEAPGLGEPKEPKGKHKSSGYGDLDTDIKVEKVKANVQDSLGDREAKTSNPKKVKEMPDKGVTGVEKKMKLQESAPSEREAMMDGYLSVIETNNMSEDDAVAYLEDQGVDQNMINTIIKYAFPLKADKDIPFQGMTENESVYQQLEDLQNELMSEKDPERKKEIENKILSLEKSLSESKLRSIIKSIIKEELNK